MEGEEQKAKDKLYDYKIKKNYINKKDNCKERNLIKVHCLCVWKDHNEPLLKILYTN
jgi:hypothetical protein